MDKIKNSIFAFTFLALFVMLMLCNRLMICLNKIESRRNILILPVYQEITYEEQIIEDETIEVVEEEIQEEIIVETEEEILEELKVLETILTAELGRVQGPVEQETYYNLPMDKVIYKMRERGYSELDYPYWIREDGVKMLGDFIMVAANLSEYPRGTVVQTSLGQGLVCDECEHGEEFDIAVEW